MHQNAYWERPVNNIMPRFIVGEWKDVVVEDPKTGGFKITEYFGGNIKMEEKKEQKYLGDILSSDGTHSKNIQDRKNKAYGVINQISRWQWH